MKSCGRGGSNWNGTGRGRSSATYDSGSTLQQSFPGTIFSEKRFNWLMDGDASLLEKIRNPKEACEFITYLIHGPEKRETLNRLVSSEHGLDALQQSLKTTNSVQFIQWSVIPLIRFIADDERMSLASARGSVVSTVLQTIFDTPILFLTLVDHVIERQLSQEDCVLVAWLAVQVLKGGDIRALRAKADVNVKRLAKAFKTKEYPTAKVISCELNNLLQQVYKKESDDLFEGESAHVLSNDLPGWRHTNDIADFRAISVPPMVEELTCHEDAFLPKTATVFEQARNAPSYLDWCFRLLREDVIRSVKEEVASLLYPSLNSPASNKVVSRLRSRSINVIKFAEISCNYHFGVGFKVLFDEPRQLARRVEEIRELETVEQLKKVYWKDHPHILKQQSLLAFIAAETILVSIGVVNVRDLEELAKSPSRIDVFFFDKADIRKTILELGTKQNKLVAYQLSTALFAFEPILERLKMLSTVPFDEELLHWPSNVCPPKYCDEKLQQLLLTLDSISPDSDLAPLLGVDKPLVLDASQKAAVTSSLKNRVALIQGPPGTGKTYCGAIISKIIHDFSRETILCVCYTNRALDSFLESLLDFGIPKSDVVRIGSAEKISERVKPLALFNQLGTIGARRIFGDLRRRMDKVDKEIHMHTTQIAALNSTENMSDLAAAFDNESADAFKVPQKQCDIAADYLWHRWLSGEDQGVMKSLFPRKVYPWSLSGGQRKEKVREWRKAVIEPVMQQLDRCISRYCELTRQFSEINQDEDIALLKTKRLIACTTTAAAKYATKLDAVNAGVVIIEEAAQIVEVHVVTSLAADCQQLILIGDHKQLRPKLNVYDLSIESGGPYAFNKSLFERLATNKFPLVTLEMQHRMRPQIAELVRELTYPELRDAEEVRTERKDVVGLLANVVFLNHEYEESSDSTLSDNLSKMNLYEVEMASKIVQYFLRKGYNGSHMVVLTPYLAQLHALKLALSKVIQVELSELDVAELGRFGLGCSSTVAQFKKQSPSVRVATVDNFQGEEANIVIASLVRSNADGRIGFVGQPERVNVLLSRAKEGLILLGNIKTFENSKTSTSISLWQKLITMLRKQQAIFSYFPAVCAVHNKVVKLKSPEDFDKFASLNCFCDGGRC